VTCRLCLLAFNMENLVKRLGKRGWGQKEINKAVDVIKNAKQNKTKDNIFLEKRIYWILLAVIIVGNFAIAISLIPLLMALKGAFLYIIVITLGIVFGLIFELVIRSIEHLEAKHHFILAFLIPLIALVNVFIITRISNNLASTLSLGNFNSPMIVSIVYAASFVLPYILYRFVLKMGYYAKE